MAFGTAAFNNNSTLKAEMDLEAHALGPLIHDLGWDMRPNSPWVIRNIVSRLHHDGIVLQAIMDVTDFKNMKTQWMISSVGFDLPGPQSPFIRPKDYDSIPNEFPNDDLFRGTNETFTWLAASKLKAANNTCISDFGFAYVSGYDETGHSRLFDIVQTGLEAELAARKS
ncbi:hypothetical protein GGS21DRAFT_489370 [Xylaria nigripes]|nr:hypothetical protein GGS21DRAFT_489370 [Xylaria nigripes]